MAHPASRHSLAARLPRLFLIAVLLLLASAAFRQACASYKPPPTAEVGETSIVISNLPKDSPCPIELELQYDAVGAANVSVNDSPEATGPGDSVSLAGHNIGWQHPPREYTHYADFCPCCGYSTVRTSSTNGNTVTDTYVSTSEHGLHGMTSIVTTVTTGSNSCACCVGSTNNVCGNCAANGSCCGINTFTSSPSGDMTVSSGTQSYCICHDGLCTTTTVVTNSTFGGTVACDECANDPDGICCRTTTADGCSSASHCTSNGCTITGSNFLPIGPYAYHQTGSFLLTVTPDANGVATGYC